MLIDNFVIFARLTCNSISQSAIVILSTITISGGTFRSEARYSPLFHHLVNVIINKYCKRLLEERAVELGTVLINIKIHISFSLSKFVWLEVWKGREGWESWEAKGSFQSEGSGSSSQMPSRVGFDVEVWNSSDISSSVSVVGNSDWLESTTCFQLLNVLPSNIDVT